MKGMLSIFKRKKNKSSSDTDSVGPTTAAPQRQHQSHNSSSLPADHEETAVDPLEGVDEMLAALQLPATFSRPVDAESQSKRNGEYFTYDDDDDKPEPLADIPRYSDASYADSSQRRDSNATSLGDADPLCFCEDDPQFFLAASSADREDAPPPQSSSSHAAAAALQYDEKLNYDDFPVQPTRLYGATQCVTTQDSLLLSSSIGQSEEEKDSAGDTTELRLSPAISHSISRSLRGYSPSPHSHTLSHSLSHTPSNRHTPPQYPYTQSYTQPQHTIPELSKYEDAPELYSQPYAAEYDQSHAQYDEPSWPHNSSSQYAHTMSLPSYTQPYDDNDAQYNEESSFTEQSHWGAQSVAPSFAGNSQMHLHTNSQQPTNPPHWSGASLSTFDNMSHFDENSQAFQQQLQFLLSQGYSLDDAYTIAYNQQAAAQQNVSMPTNPPHFSGASLPSQMDPQFDNMSHYGLNSQSFQQQVQFLLSQGYSLDDAYAIAYNQHTAAQQNVSMMNSQMAPSTHSVYTQRTAPSRIPQHTQCVAQTRQSAEDLELERILALSLREEEERRSRLDVEREEERARVDRANAEALSIALQLSFEESQYDTAQRQSDIEAIEAANKEAFEKARIASLREGFLNSRQHASSVVPSSAQSVFSQGTSVHSGGAFTVKTLVQRRPLNEVSEDVEVFENPMRCDVTPRHHTHHTHTYVPPSPSQRVLSRGMSDHRLSARLSHMYETSRDAAAAAPTHGAEDEVLYDQYAPASSLSSVSREQQWLYQR